MVAATLPYVGSLTPVARAAKLPGFTVLRDTQDKYLFAYPFGWQEVSVDGSDVVYKDVIEPLESVSMTIFPTQKKDVAEFGSPEEVATTLVTQVGGWCNWCNWCNRDTG